MLVKYITDLPDNTNFTEKPRREIYIILYLIFGDNDDIVKEIIKPSFGCPIKLYNTGEINKIIKNISLEHITRAIDADNSNITDYKINEGVFNIRKEILTSPLI
jgi:hypothetical protein